MDRSSFPLSWEQVRWRSRRCAVSDLRFVTLRRGEVVEEIALSDIASIDIERSRLQKLIGAGTVVLRSARGNRLSVRLPFVFRPRRTALLLNLLIGDIRGLPPDETVASFPFPAIWRIPGNTRVQVAMIFPVILATTAVAVLIGLSGHQMHIAYAANDAIRPNGHERDRAQIVAFMESDVMPFARRALEPVVGKGNVTCHTCHGEAAEQRGWKMPAVRALPEPAVREIAIAAGADSQIRNALHGYLAEGDNQRIAAHMRGVVLPGMARLLHRPVYDFAQSYEYNSQRNALGCYHCHMVTAT